MKSSALFIPAKTHEVYWFSSLARWCYEFGFHFLYKFYLRYKLLISPPQRTLLKNHFCVSINHFLQTSGVQNTSA